MGGSGRWVDSARAVLVALTVFVIASCVSWALHDPSQVRPDDPSFYWRMANGTVVSAPFGYRIMVPAIVRALPLDHHVGFTLMTGIAIAAIAITFWAWGARHTSKGRAAAAASIVVASGPVWNQVMSPYRNDVEMMALMGLAVLLSDRRRWYAFTIVAVLAVATRDVAAIIVVVPLLASCSERDPRALVAVAATIATAFAIRGYVTVLPRALQDPRAILAWRAHEDGSIASAAMLAVATSFGAAWLLVPGSWRRLDRNTKWWAGVALLAIPTLVVASDWSRLLAPAAALICMSAIRSTVATRGLVALAILLLATNLNHSVAASVCAFALGGAVLLVCQDRERTCDVAPPPRPDRPAIPVA